MLSFTLISSSYMGVLQERLALMFGKHPRESLFYNVSVFENLRWFLIVYINVSLNTYMNTM